MKMIMLRLLALLLAVAMLLCITGCQDPADTTDPSEDEGDGNTTVDPATDGVFNALDYDPEKDYQLPDYRALTITDYISLGRYKGLTLTLSEEEFTITDTVLENRIETILQENHPGAKITDRVVAWNDTVVVDYVGKKDGVAFDRGSAENQTIEVTEENGYIPGFIEGLVGLTPGVATDVPMTFPEDYDEETLAGQDVVFTFTVHYIVGHPELTDDFVADYTEGEFTTAQAYRDDLRAEMQQEAYDVALRIAFWNKICENAAVKKYHEDAVMYYYSYYYELYSYYAAMYGLTVDVYLMYMGSSVDAMFEACCQIAKEEMVYYAVFAAGEYTYTDEQYQRALELYTDENMDRLNEMMSTAGKEEYTRESAMAYFDEQERQTIVLQTLEEIAYNDLIEGYTIEITPVETEEEEGTIKDGEKTEGGESTEDGEDTESGESEAQ